VPGNLGERAMLSSPPGSSKEVDCQKLENINNYLQVIVMYVAENRCVRQPECPVGLFGIYHNSNVRGMPMNFHFQLGVPEKCHINILLRCFFEVGWRVFVSLWHCFVV
jgi:hypothetical protein